MKYLERTVNLIAAGLTIITFILSFYPAFSKNAVELPYYFNEPLSLIRFLVAGILIMSCNYGISYPCARILTGNLDKAAITALSGIFIFVSAWINISILKYILYSEAFYFNNSFIVAYSILLLLTIFLFTYFISKQIDSDQSFLDEDFAVEFFIFLFIIYIIVWFSTIAFNPNDLTEYYNSVVLS